jgi:mannose-6-phosphate isomerase
MDLLDNVIQHYAWGSLTDIAHLQGREIPTSQPEAELWMGAHPRGSSIVERDGRRRELLEVIVANPELELGPNYTHFGKRLPFLLKILAARQPLSIQVHPNSEQASAGFAAEQASGVPLGDPKRNYVDSYHKPEVLYAISEFEVLAGFRSVEDILPVFMVLVENGAPVLQEYVARLAQPDGLRATVTSLLTLPDPRPVVEQFLAACRNSIAAGLSYVEEYSRSLWIAESFPGDIGVVVALLLNHLTVQPGQAIFSPAGVLHAYLRGLGIEIMASSDNVLRGGLTKKHIDVSELLKITHWSASPAQLLSPVSIAPGVLRWETPVPDFALTRITLESNEYQAEVTGPRIVFCLNGTITAQDAQASVQLSQGTSAYACAAAGPIALSGTGTVFLASPGRISKKA